MNLFEQHLKSGWSAFESYAVKIRVNDLVGGIPQTTDMIKKWVDATNKDKSAEDRAKIVEAHLSRVDDMVEEVGDKQGICFLRQDGFLVVEGRCVKAMLKEAGNIIKEIAPNGIKDGKPVEGVTALKSKVSDKMFVVEKYITTGKTKPDSVEERPIHVMTRQGPRTSIKRCEVVKDVEVCFTIKRRRGPNKSGVSEKVMLAILDYAQTSGLGSDRSQGRGQFEVLSVEKL